MTVPSPSSPTLSPVYFSENSDANTMDFGSTSVASTSVGDATDTIDNSPQTVISPVARRILLEHDSEEEDMDSSGDTSTRKLPLGVPFDDDENEEPGRRESQHSLPDAEELKLSVAAAAGRESTSSNRRKRLYMALLFVLALAMTVFLAKFFGPGRTTSKPITSQTETDQTSTYNDTTIDNGSPSDSQTSEDRFTRLQYSMIRYGIAAMEDFRDMTSPHAQASRWMAYEDNRPLPENFHAFDPTTAEGYEVVSRYVMAVLYFATDGKNWKDSLGFLDPDKHTCDWFQVFEPPKGEVGVLCNQSTRTIIGVSLISNNVRGKIPSELSQLTSLEYLESIENFLSGTIPTEWQSLTALRTVVIAFNELTGGLPSWMPQSWPNMEFLYLSNNALTGTIPEEFFEFQKLSVLALDDNILTGNTDVVWHSMRSLEHLYLEDNEFTGALPNGISQTNPILKVLDLSSNKLTGSLPDDIFELNRLEVLDLHDNQFDSSIPANFPEDNYNLNFLALHKNKLSGNIPSSITNLKRLAHLDLTSNQLTGTIPNDLERLSSYMTYLFLGDNDYREGPIPSFVYAMTNLRELSLKSSKRTGTISGIIGALDSMLVLDLENNQLTGSIPDQIGMMTGLQFLLLNKNQLSLVVPGTELAKLEDLRFLLLDNNHLVGDLDPSCQLKSLTSVYVDCGEVSCSCCTCCSDGKPCHDNLWISSHDPVWESEYTRQFFDFDHESESFYSNRDDDYWK